MSSTQNTSLKNSKRVIDSNPLDASGVVMRKSSTRPLRQTTWPVNNNEKRTGQPAKERTITINALFITT